MAGIPWLAVFAGLTLVSMRRGHSVWITGLWIFCIGVGAANTGVGQAVYDGATSLLGAVWGAAISFFNSVAS